VVLQSEVLEYESSDGSNVSFQKRDQKDVRCIKDSGQTADAGAKQSQYSVPTRSTSICQDIIPLS
jgi:hypothetical protein